MAEGTLSARMVLRVVEFCRARGIDVDALCAQAGVTVAALAEPDARVPYATAMRVGELALVATGDDDFGLHLAMDVRDVGNFDTATLLLMASPTVRVALERMVANQRYWGDGDRAALVPERAGVAIRWILPGATGTYARHGDECALAEVTVGVQVMTGKPVRPRVVRFRHAKPRSLEAHVAIFGCPLEFDAMNTEAVFDDAVLDTPMQHANDVFCAIFEQQVERALGRLPAATRTSASVRAAVRGALAGGGCTLDGTARALGVSTRTMQRRLQTEGTSFAELVDALRREMAVAYLDRGLPIPEVASLLGYADTTAFHHAFRRWTGSSPLRRAAAED
ncbi:MAG TPA: AraC family transcriptional regulator [Polyangiaceae bacterium]|jgi:AraC-like DNA-binding protein|nr:AraC family transcriptional regulator [Polyangiaceae bacterium]